MKLIITLSLVWGSALYGAAYPLLEPSAFNVRVAEFNRPSFPETLRMENKSPSEPKVKTLPINKLETKADKKPQENRDSVTEPTVKPELIPHQAPRTPVPKPSEIEPADTKWSDNEKADTPEITEAPSKESEQITEMQLLPYPPLRNSFLSVAPSINLIGRMDLAYQSGNPQYTGFMLSTLQFGVEGQLNPYIEYRFLMGQTREYASVLLPQLIPTDAFIHMRSRPERESAYYGHLAWRVGMFAPILVPWWTDDESIVDIPTSHYIHQTVLLNNEIGSYIEYFSKNYKTRINIGVYNGNGLLALNTNNSVAFTGHISSKFRLLDGELQLGVTGFYLKQGSLGNINYKEEMVADAFVSINWEKVELFGDYFQGSFKSNSLTARPTGFLVGGKLEVFQKLRLYGKYESISNPPETGVGQQSKYEFGTIYEIHPRLESYNTYSFFKDTTSSNITALEFKLRLTL